MTRLDIPTDLGSASRRLAALAAILVLSGTLIALAQPLKETRTQIETGRLELTQIEAALQRDTLDDKRLNDLRTRIDPLAKVVDEIIQREQPRADEVKALVDKLGPAPDLAKGGTESADVARDRAEQTKLWKEADETLRLSRALALRVEQTKEAIADRRRQNFTRQILAQGASIASPLLWLDVTKALPSDFRALQFLMTQWVATIYANLDWYEIVVLLLLAFAAIVGIPRARQWVQSGSIISPDVPPLAASSSDEEDISAAPTRLARAFVALRMVLLNAVAPAGLLYLVYWLFQSFGVLPGRVDPVMEAITSGLAFVVAMSGLAYGMLSPNRREWRLFDISDWIALRLWRLVRLVALIVMIGRVVDTLQGAIVASLPLTVATKGIFAVLVVLAMARGLRRAFHSEARHASSESPARQGAGLLPVRLAAWCVTIAILGAALFGYVALAGFLVNQVVWLTILGLGALLLLVFVEEVLGVGLSARGNLGRRVREVTGLTASSLDQFSVLGSGMARLVLYIALVMLALAPWGLDSSNLFGNLRAAFFGFQVGGVTISLSTIAIALALFVVGFLVTRAIQNWLETNYLPHTDLDIGLRNSIRTVFGYVGVIIAAMIALAQLGLSLEKLTIVAGALSVGIGFGLQSIVNNFVSGLILLWERPIRVGDFIVVGDEQGTVRRINVRATEIETFDCASLIIPNSEFISGRVKNWMHANRTARIVVPINVAYNSDPVEVEALLNAAASAHREVLSEPPSFVRFKNLGESGLDFELSCYVDVDSRGSTRSELLYDIFRRLKEAGIDIPYPTRRLEITNLPVSDGKPSVSDLLGDDRPVPKGSKGNAP